MENMSVNTNAGANEAEEELDLEYDVALGKLNDAIVTSKREKNTALLQSFITENHGTDISNILMHIDGEIESISHIDDNARRVIRDQRNGRKLHNRIFVWYMEGNQRPEVLMSRYTEFCNEYPAFRTVYMVKGLKQPVKIVLKPEKNFFPITNLSNISPDRINFIIKNVLAAEIRREYDIERDSILKLQMFEIGPRKIIVVLSMYAFPGFQFGGIRNFLFKVFEGYKIAEGDVPNINDPSIEKMNRAIKNKALFYWDEMLRDNPEATRYPGMNLKNAENKNESDFFSIDEKSSVRFFEYAKLNSVCLETVIMKAWGRLLNKANETKKCVLGMVCRGEAMNVVPVVYKDNTKLVDFEQQIKDAVSNTVCSLDNISDYSGNGIEKYFNVVHNFVDYSIIDETLVQKKNGELAVSNFADLERVNPAVTINYYLFEDRISVNYIYKKGIFDNDDTEFLKNALISSLREMIDIDIPEEVNGNYKKEASISQKPTAKKQTEQSILANRALVLKSSRLFDSLTIDELMELAKECEQHRYSYGDALITEGNYQTGILIVAEGEVAHRKLDPRGRMMTGGYIGRGSVIGLEMMMFDRKAIGSYFVNSERVRVVEIPGDVFYKYANSNTEIYRSIINRMMKYMNSLFEVLCDQMERSFDRERIILKRRELERKKANDEKKIYEAEEVIHDSPVLPHGESIQSLHNNFLKDPTVNAAYNNTAGVINNFSNGNKANGANTPGNNNFNNIGNLL